jgi:hypothetical protein
MYFIKIENGLPKGFPLIESNIRNMFPETPAGYIPEDIIPGYVHYIKTDSPTTDDLTKEFVEGGAVKNADGAFVQTWEERDKVFDTAADKQAAINATASVRMQQVRSTRDGLLAATDWMGMSDVIMSNEMATYRQELRDLPAIYVSNPEDVVWPISPDYVDVQGD